MSTDQSPTHERRWLWLLVGLTLLLRGMTAAFGPDHFDDDRDAYLVLAQGVAEGRGLCVQGSDKPTAYRPPLYPLIIAAASAAGTGGHVGRGTLHAALAALMVWLIWRSGKELGLGVGSRFLAGAIVAADPMLIVYANFPMTETVCAMLGAWLLERFLAPCRTAKNAVLCGFVLGLCLLSRPTFWVTGALLCPWMLLTWRTRSFAGPNSGTPGNLSVLLLATALTVLPWVLRNWLVMGHPILMTTHGGYTLLLGNNEDFYEQVVAKSWSTEWTGKRQQRWAEGVNRRLDELGLKDEVDRDHRMGSWARKTIAAHPGLFAKACLARVIQFWQVVPGGEVASRYSPWVLVPVVIWYLAIWVLSLRGLWIIGLSRLRRWVPVLLIPLSFTLVHAVYWSNIRMRAPVMPAVALVAALGAQRRGRRGLRKEDHPV